MSTLEWLVLVLGLLVVASLFSLVWVAVQFAKGRDLMERANAGKCTCTRYRLCAVCLAELREPRSKTERSQSA